MSQQMLSLPPVVDNKDGSIYQIVESCGVALLLRSEATNQLRLVTIRKAKGLRVRVKK